MRDGLIKERMWRNKMTRQIDYDDLMEVLLDMQGIESLLVHLETSEYLKPTEEDTLVFRVLRNSLEHTKNKINSIMEIAYKSQE